MPDVDDDLSASTARFQAFAASKEEDPAPWRMRAPATRIALLAGAVVVVAVVVYLLARLLAG
jgi:uncharacterized membrane protein